MSDLSPGCFENLFLFSIGNCMISSAIWEKTCTSEFFKDLKMHESKGRVLFVIFEKPTSACFFQISWEIMLLFVLNRNKFSKQPVEKLLINNVHEKIFGNVFTTYMLAVLHPSQLLATLDV